MNTLKSELFDYKGEVVAYRQVIASLQMEDTTFPKAHRTVQTLEPEDDVSKYQWLLRLGRSLDVDGYDDIK